MRRVEVLSTSEFRTAVIASLLIAAILAVAGWSTFHIVRNTMMRQLEAQLVEEVVLFRRIFETGGIAALVETLRSLEDAPTTEAQFASLFDETGTRLAGNIRTAPDLVLVQSSSVVATTQEGENILELGTPIRTETLVVGRDIAPINSTLSTLARSLLAAGLAILVACLGVGWLASRSSIAKLNRVSQTLALVGEGETGARVGLSGRGQIDRIGGLIDNALDRLSALMTASQNTTRAIAHDLRTPLNRALMLVQEGVAAPAADRADLLEQASDELLAVGRIFDTVLQIGRLEASADRTDFVALDLGELAREATSLVETDAEAKDQIISVEADDAVVVHGQPQMLKQLLTNLLVNAIRHTPRGSQILVQVSIRGDRPELEVSDNGPGIAEAERDKVLKPFVRLDESRSEPGSGLGLTLVHAIAIRHGAQLVLEDNRPGLRVRIVFP